MNRIPAEDNGSASFIDESLLSALLSLSMEEEFNFDFAMFGIRQIVKSHPQRFIRSVFSNRIEKKSRIFAFDILLEEDPGDIDDCIYEGLAAEFKAVSDELLTSCSSPEAKILPDPRESTKILEVLCKTFASQADASKVLWEKLKKDKSLLIDCVYVLRMVREAEKSSNEDAKHKVDAENDPAFGFKRNLVKMIGNLTHRCKENQDLVRDIEGIQVLLDCSGMEDKNPFITQWVVFALRNVCEDNEENQSVIAALKRLEMIAGGGPSSSRKNGDSENGC